MVIIIFEFVVCICVMIVLDVKFENIGEIIVLIFIIVSIVIIVFGIIGI